MLSPDVKRITVQVNVPIPVSTDLNGRYATPEVMSHSTDDVNVYAVFDRTASHASSSSVRSVSGVRPRLNSRKVRIKSTAVPSNFALLQSTSTLSRLALMRGHEESTVRMLPDGLLPGPVAVHSPSVQSARPGGAGRCPRYLPDQGTRGQTSPASRARARARSRGRLP
jgi:hypothetical protein